MQQMTASNQVLADYQQQYVLREKLNPKNIASA
jgi:hypothetical protein